MKPGQFTPVDDFVPRDGLLPEVPVHGTKPLRRFLPPRGLKARLARAAAREGAVNFTVRQATGALNRLGERARTIWYSRRRWQSDGRPLFVFITHRCGGGTEQHAADMRARLRAEGIRVVVVRPGRAGLLVWEERNNRDRLAWCRESNHELAAMKQLLEVLRPVHAHVHHVIGVPLALIDLLSDQGIPYDWTVHDYYTICPRVSLATAENSYCGAMDLGTCDRCLAGLDGNQVDPVATSVESWRRRFAGYLGGARRVFVPSEDVRDRLDRYFSELSILLRPHPESLPNIKSLAAVPVPGEAVRVAIVGTLTAIKGSERLLACAANALERGLPLEFHVIGTTDHDAAFRRLRNVRVSGRYRQHEVYARLAAARCHLAFLPSLLPESYMYTLSVVMASGFYTVCFDLGAQASRLRSWGWGHVLPLGAAPAAINDSLLAAAERLASDRRSPSPPPPAQYRDVLRSYYGFSPEERARLFERPAAVDRPVEANPHLVQRKSNEGRIGVFHSREDGRLRDRHTA
jgi:glycosyltransferase involved in cell wall biosynthesis